MEEELAQSAKKNQPSETVQYVYIQQQTKQFL